VALAAAGFLTAAGLLDHLPKRYEDRRRFDAFPNQPTPARFACAAGSSTSRRHFGRGKGFYEAVVMDGSGGVFGSGKITCRWFNMPFIHKLWRRPGSDRLWQGQGFQRPPDHRSPGV
jgi:ATP-dependent DNA helicase RecG